MSYYCHQALVRVPPKRRGCHLITDVIEREIQQEMFEVKAGVCNLVLQHTTAALSVNECGDENAKYDMIALEDKIVRLSDEDYEKSDDPAAQQLAGLIGANVTIPVTDGKLVLGTWQGVYLNEYTLSGKERTIVVTITGKKRE